MENEVSRRTFLQWIIASLSAAIGLVLGGTGTGYFLSPAFKKEDEGWIDVGSVREVSRGAPVKLEFTQRKKDGWMTVETRSSAWFLTSNGRDFVAFDPRCTHLGCPYRWDADKKQFLCPCHTATFAVDGRVVSGPPPRPLDRFPVKVVRERLQIIPQALESGKA
ncbi:MAG: hypothetical protein A3G41_00420 [Elusimicrobia bacterium RIFCSPLOWO2_12_FULL_59_9]|nr:MAG: hypothetical protein A3G41_00420 [Elusimicrobia bacterium RIFCSPLOWO2_12_FULL_59_9]